MIKMQTGKAETETKTRNSNPSVGVESVWRKSVPSRVHFVSLILRGFHRLGIPAGPSVLLTVRGRKSGRKRTTPVVLFQHDGHRYIFAEFGEVDWVRNLRSAAEAIIARGRRREEVIAVELSPEEAAPIMKIVFAPFLASRMWASTLRMGFELTKDSSTDDYLKEVRRHPGFELRSKTTG